MSNLPNTRQSLLAKMSAGCTDAWSEFCEIYGKAVYAYCRFCGLQDADAHDVCQHLLIKVERQLRDKKHDATKGRFRGWMFTVARNLAIDRVREINRESLIHEPSFSELPATANRETDSENFDVQYQRELLLWAAEQVKPLVKESSWQSFWRTAIEGQNASDVARQLGVKLGVVYTAKSRVIARIRSAIQALEEIHGASGGLFQPEARSAILLDKKVE